MATKCLGVLLIMLFLSSLQSFQAQRITSTEEAGRTSGSAEKEKEYVLKVIEATGQNMSRAAEILDIDRRTLYQILERHGIQPG